MEYECTILETNYVEALQPWALTLLGWGESEKVSTGEGLGSRSGSGPTGCAGRSDWRPPFSRGRPLLVHPVLTRLWLGPGVLEVGVLDNQSSWSRNQNAALEHGVEDRYLILWRGAHKNLVLGTPGCKNTDCPGIRMDTQDALRGDVWVLRDQPWHLEVEMATRMIPGIGLYPCHHGRAPLSCHSMDTKSKAKICQTGGGVGRARVEDWSNSTMSFLRPALVCS